MSNSQYAPPLDVEVVKILLESAWASAQRSLRNDIIKKIQDLSSICSPTTGHGKAQRYFANLIISEIIKL